MGVKWLANERNFHGGFYPTQVSTSSFNMYMYVKGGRFPAEQLAEAIQASVTSHRGVYGGRPKGFFLALVNLPLLEHFILTIL